MSTRSPLRRRALLAIPTAAVVAAMMGSPAMAATPTPASGASLSGAASTLAPTSQGIIMRDGGVCDPIRHMGC